MLLGYESLLLLRDKNNQKEVGNILEQLDSDFITPEVAKEKKRLLNRLKELGEMDIYNRLIKME